MWFYLAFAVLFLWAVRAVYLRSKLPKGAKWLPGPPGMPCPSRVFWILDFVICICMFVFFLEKKSNWAENDIFSQACR